MLDFLKEKGQCAFDFKNADKYPFEEELIVKDKFYDCLCIQDEKIDVIAQNLFTSYYKILNAAMKEQLPGGAFYTLNSKKITETSSVIPHNKLPERAFGMLDFLIRNRPKALVAQLRFRSNVLKQVVKDKSIFNATSKGKHLSIEQLTMNVRKLI